MSVTTAQAISLLENVLFETPAQATANAASWVSLSNLNSSYSTVAGLASAMAQTAEATIAEQVVRYYEGALGRAPAGVEVAYYVNIIENGNTAAGIPAMLPSQITEGATAVPGATWSEIASFFAASPEFAFASAGSNVVNLLYLNILGRAPNAAEVTYYQNLIATGTKVSTLVQYFTTSPEYQTKVDASIQGNLASYGTTVANGGTAPATIGPITTTAPTVTNLALSNSVDTPTVTGNTTVSGTFNAGGTTPTFTAGDTIAATGTGNTLSISDLGVSGVENLTNNATSVVGATVSGVQTLAISASQGVYADTTTSSEGLTGLTALTIKAIGSANPTTDGYGVEVIAGSGVSVTATDLSAGAAKESILGGNNVSLTVNGVTAGGTITVGSATQAPVGTVTVVATENATQHNTTSDVITVTGGTTVSVTANLAGAVNYTTIGGAIQVNGTAVTTAVSVTQTAATTAHTNTSGVTDGAVTIRDAASASTTTANTITSVTLVNYGNNSVISDNALTTLSLTGGTGALAITTAGSGTGATSLNLNLTGLTGGTITDTNNEITTLTIVNSGKSSLTFADTGLTTVKISGTGNVTSDLTNGGLNTNVATVTDSVTGVSNLTLGTTASFDGTGSGQDVITLSGVTSGTLKGGSATNNELILGLTGTGVTTLGTVTGFSELGFNGSSGGTYDLSALTGYTSFELVGNVGAALTLLKATAGSPVAIDVTQSNGALNYNVVDTSGASDSLALTLGTASGSGITVAAINAYDSNTTTVGGVGTLTVASTYTNAGYVNVINALDGASVVGGGVSSLTVTGNASLQIGTWTDFVAALTIANNSTSSSANSYVLNDNKLTSLTLSGTTTGATALTLTDTLASAAGFTLNVSGASATTITDSALTVVSSLTVLDSATAALTVGATSDIALTSASLTNTGSATLTAGDINNSTGTTFTTLTIAGTGAVTLGSSVTTGLTLADTTASVTITDSDTAAVTIYRVAETAGTSGALTISDTGAGALTISTLTDTSTGTLTITKTGAGSVSIGGVAGTIGATAIHLTDSNTSGSLSFGSSTVTVTDNAATSVVGSGTGKESLYLADNDAAVLTVDFSGSSANDVISIARGAGQVTPGVADVYKVGNGNNTLTITAINPADSTDTIYFGSGANTISDIAHTTGVHNYINTAATGLNTVNAFSTISGTSTTSNTDTLKFVGNTVTSTNSVTFVGATSVGAGVAWALANLSQNEAGTFTVGNNTYVFDHGGSSSTALSATDSMVEIMGTTTLTLGATNTLVNGVIILHH